MATAEFDLDQEVSRMFEHLEDYVVISPVRGSVNTDDFLGFLWIEPMEIRLAGRLTGLSPEARRAHAWQKVGERMWKMLPPKSELLEQEAGDAQ